MAAVTVIWYDEQRQEIVRHRIEGPPKAAWYQVAHEVDPPLDIPVKRRANPLVTVERCPQHQEPIGDGRSCIACDGGVF